MYGRGCRCSPCKAARKDHQQRYRAKDPAKVNAYCRADYAKDPVSARERTTVYRKANPERVRATQLLSNYGITILQWNVIFDAQGRVCGCCGRAVPGNLGWCVEHRHPSPEETGLGEVRGITCQQCNSGIGLLGDDVAGVERALDFVKNGAARVRKILGRS